MKGIMFKEELFLSILNGGKTQTRRVIQNPPPSMEKYVVDGKVCHQVWDYSKPRYIEGDVIYLKEPYHIAVLSNGEDEILYKYGENRGDLDWKNKMFMPRLSARYFIEINNVHAEYLNDISEEDAIEEGVDCITDVRAGKIIYKNYLTGKYQLETAKESFISLFKSINGENKNPAVWAYDFSLLKSIPHHD